MIQHRVETSEMEDLRVRLAAGLAAFMLLLPQIGTAKTHQHHQAYTIPTEWRVSNYIRAGWRITAVTPNQGDLASLNQMVVLEKRAGVILCLISPKISGENIEQFETTWCRWVR